MHRNISTNHNLLKHVHTYIHACIHAYRNVYIYVHICTYCIYSDVYTYTHVHMKVCEQVYTFVHVCMLLSASLSLSLPLLLSLSMSIFLLTYTCQYIVYIYTFIYAYVYAHLHTSTHEYVFIPFLALLGLVAVERWVVNGLTHGRKLQGSWTVDSDRTWKPVSGESSSADPSCGTMGKSTMAYYTGVVHALEWSSLATLSVDSLS